MTCENVKAQMSDYLDAGLDWSLVVEFENHIDSCDACRAELSELSRLVSRLKNLPEIPVPCNFHDHLMEGVKKEITPPSAFYRFKPFFIKWKVPAYFAAAFLFLVVVVSYFNSIPSEYVEIDNAYDLGNTVYSKVGESATPQAPLSAPAVVTSDDYAAPEYSSIEEDSVYLAREQDAKEFSLEDTVEIADESALVGSSNTISSLSSQNQKIIRTSFFSLEVVSFDDTVEKLNELAFSLGGYVEDFSSNLQQNYVNSNRQYVELKNGSLVLKLPVDAYIGVKNSIPSFGKVINESEQSQNITWDYIDTEARLTVKMAEESRLLELLAKAEKVDDLILLEQRLSFVRSDIESVQSQLKNWDKLVQYSTIHLYITEKDSYQLQQTDSSMTTLIKQGFVYSLNNTRGKFEYILIESAKNIVPISFFICLIVIVVIIILIKSKKNKK